MLRKLRKIVFWVVTSVVLLILTLAVLLYIPGVQNWVKDIVLKEINKSSDMNISVGYIRLKFPLSLSVEDVKILEASGDTMLLAQSADVNVRFWPLLKGDINVTGAQLSEVFYQFGNQDSAVWLRAAVNDFDLNFSSLNFGKERISVSSAKLNGGDVTLILKDTITEEPIDTTAPSKLLITADYLEMQNVKYHMKMLPYIDSIDAYMAKAVLHDGVVDLGNRRIAARSVTADDVEALYLYPSDEFLSTYVSADTLPAEETPDSLLWSINVDKIMITGKSATYAMSGVKPQPGLDFNYLQALDISIEVDSFYNRGINLRVPVKKLSGTERCGIHLNATGLFAMDTVLMYADNFKINTDFSELFLDASLGMGDMTLDPDVPIKLKATGRFGLEDLKLAYPFTNKYLFKWMMSNDIQLIADISGTSGNLDIKELKLDYAPLTSLTAMGQIENLMDDKNLIGRIRLNGYLKNLDRIKSLFLEPAMANDVHLPTINLNGNANFSPDKISGELTAETDGGSMSLNAIWKPKTEGYNLGITINNLPVGKIYPSLGLENLSGSASATGRGFDFLSPLTTLDARIDIGEAVYTGYTFRDIIGTANLEKGNFSAELVSNNDDAMFDIDLTGTLSRQEYTWKLNGDIETLNLEELGFSETENSGSVMISSQGSIDTKGHSIDGWITVDDLDWNIEGKRLSAERIEANMSATDSIMFATLRSGDFDVRLAAFNPLDTILSRLTVLPAVIDSTIVRRSVNIPDIQHSIPNMDLEVNIGRSNFLQNYLLQSDMGFQKASLSFRNDSLLSMDTKLLGLVSGDMRIDTLSFGAVQHGQFLAFTGAMNNRPGVMDDFAHVTLTGYLSENKVTLVLRQKNIENEQGFFLGANLNVQDSTAILRFVPYTPTIGYKQWQLNNDNFIEYNFITHHIDANLSMTSDKSYLKIYTEHIAGEEHQEDVILEMSDIRLQDWLSISPFSPPIKGDLGAKARIHWDEGVLTGSGEISLENLYYGKDRVGDFDLGVDVTTDHSGMLKANASLMVDKYKVITASGSLNDTTSIHPFNLDFSMIHFPLKVINPFLPKEMAQLQGFLDGEMDITGSVSSPVFNGYLDFDSTAIKIGMLGSSLTFSEKKIPVDSNIVRFENFAIHALNENPLTVNGTVDISSLANVGVDLGMRARNIQVVNSSRAKKGEDVYGKAFFNLDADVKGNMKLMTVDATLSVLAGTNVTYIMTDAESALTSQNTHDLVKFVNFADSAMVEMADTITPTMALILNAKLNINQGSVINVDLSSDGTNKVVINGEGSLDYTMSPVNPGRLTGRFNINSGYVRYTPPLMSEKLFNFENGSYIAFNGDMMNPILNIHAVDNLKANVTQSGQDSRLINFAITLSITNTLDNMNVAFNLSTNDDITVQNELASMSAEQRATQAMNLLLYNTYTGPGTKGSSNLSGNPLYAFLASQLNSWAAKNIKGVDISFGIDQYNKTTDGYTSTATSYSYKVSKTLFNDRFTIVVGGNYSTDSNADENFEQNLISDIAFEYKLNRSGSMYLKIFRHTGYESILEGEITQTGVGFVIRRKIRNLRDLFKFPRRIFHHGEQSHDYNNAMRKPDEEHKEN